MIKIVTIIGARPQIIKAAAISRAIKKGFSEEIREVIVHTGQHYDKDMSQVFFDELNIPKEDYNLEVGSGSHGEQTSAMLEKIEKVLVKENPDAVLLYGDTNSTLAASIAASKLLLPIIHIEAGLRSFKKSVPEEVNRITCDHLSTLLFSPTLTGVKNLQREGFPVDNEGPYTVDNPRVYYCGDIMYDNSLYFSEVAGKDPKIISETGLQGKKFVLVTVHRNNNTDDPQRLRSLFESFMELSQETGLDFVIPLHPRTKKALAERLDESFYNQVKDNKHLKIIPPVSFLEIINLETNAELIMTDSGGVQKEAYYFKKPALLLMDETPWVELVENKCAILTGASKVKIKEAFYHFYKSSQNLEFPEIFGDGKAAEFTCEKIVENFRK
jgi:UDP-GlcNAc3NAcA epimerase